MITYTNLQITNVATWEGGIVIYWSTNDIGFGCITAYAKDDKWILDDEFMGKSFAEAVFCKWIEGMEERY